ncbi:glycoside hydrolase family 2 TIM barrel-domain containing protein [Tessaracoccus terricola]
MLPHDEITSFAPGSGRRVPPRSHLASDAPRTDLSGPWRFHFSPRPDLAPAQAADVAFDDSDWDEIPVPSHWVLQDRPEWGRPIYTNINFPFPVDVPHVPDENPTGDYRVEFDVEESFVAEGARAHLRFGGVESLCIASLNGTRVGVVRASRLMQELDVTEELVVGRNVLHLRVHQWSSNTYLEDQDQWWLPGVFREVELLSRPAEGIDDVWLRADFDPETGAGALVPEIRAGRDAYPVTVAVEELGVRATFESPSRVAAIPVGEVEPWSADVPRLYDAQVSNAAETVSLRVGFRRVEVVGHEWRVNGAKLRLRGVNRHEYHPDLGRVFDREAALEGLLLMKRYNVNAIRTAHYPPHPELLELADELGFWVIDECDYETHGFEAGGWVDNPSDDPRWREALLDRVERFFERDKNHPCIVAWSLGNEAHTGANTAAMAAWLHRRDPERPVHYEPDFDGRYADVVSRMYASPEELRFLSEGLGNNKIGSPGRAAALAGRPMILCEYAHAMGNGSAQLDVYEELFNTLPQWHGGFVWEWRDHGLRSRTDDGREFFAYGGDFGEEIHDGNFVTDGMVLSDGTPSPMLAEFAAVCSPIKLVVDDLGLVIENRRHDGDTSDLRFVVIDEVDGELVARHEIAVDPIWPDGADDVDIPDPPLGVAGEVWRTARAELAEDTAWAPAGHVVAFHQVKLSGRAAPVLPPVADGEAPRQDGDALVLGPARFDPRTGDLLELAGHPVAGPRLELWRPPTDNDLLGPSSSFVTTDRTMNHLVDHGGPSHADGWRAAGLDRLQRRVLAVEVEPDALRVRHRYAPAAGRAAVVVELVWRHVDGELRLEADAQPTNGWSGTWPRIGLHFTLPAGVGDVEWFGTGPHENYPDPRRAAVVGRFASRVPDLTVAYARPQESGHRGELRWLELPELGLRISADEVAGSRPGFSLREHDVHEVTAAGHPHELPVPSATHLHMDAAQRGIGTLLTDPDVRPEHELVPRAAQWSLRIAAGPQRS